MKLFLSLIVMVSVACAANRAIMESRVTKFSSKSWIQLAPASDSDTIDAIFVLKRDQNLVKKFEEQLLTLATPTSPHYGKWLSKQDVINQISPERKNVEMVLEFLKSFQVSGSNVRVSDFGNKIFAKIPARVAEKMLDTEFARFRSLENPAVSILRVTKPYSLSEDIAGVVSFVDDILRFPSVRRTELLPPASVPFNVTKAGGGASPFSSCGTKCNGYTTPDVLETAYSYSPVTSVATGNSVAVAEFQYQFWDQADLDNFASACGVSLSVDVTIGANNERVCNTGCVEALLDIEYIGAITHPIPLTDIYEASYSLLGWVDQIISMDNPPLIHSVSYGNDEAQQTSAEYMQECNTEFMTAGSMGLSILFASGDQGVWGREGVGATFHPDFPAAAPYITAVGGTNFQTKSVIGAESAWNCGGGGFSDTFSIPSWQATAVADYLTLAQAADVLPAAQLYNATGRAYPDVSALGGQTNPYCVSIKGGSSFGGVAGTSASCPVVAGIFAQLNNARLAAGKSSLGWLNPFIYANGNCFNDVNDGSQNNCNAGTTGFAALNGWDPATGWGTPNFACLKTAALSYQ